MNPGIFVIAVTLVYLVVLGWACRTLPDERWQIFASIPLHKKPDGGWQGLNITFYGIIVSSGYTIGTALVLIMLCSVGLAPGQTLLLLAPMFALCVPAARWVAWIVEKKPQTLTVGGASFVGILAAPWLTLAVRALVDGAESLPGLQVLPALAAVTVGYAFGEGLGRMACISFGCCYGKPLDECPRWLRRLFAGRSFTFTGPTKKISYESGFDGRPVVPIQAVTSVVCVGAGLLGLYLFFIGHFAISFVITLTVTQLWRVFSENFRADYRGGGKWSAYQYMALISVIYGVLIAIFFRAQPGVLPNLAAGLKALWTPWVLIGLEGLWLAMLLYVGRSKVTGSLIRFHVVKNRI
jgi:hypothetical protein